MKRQCMLLIAVTALLVAAVARVPAADVEIVVTASRIEEEADTVSAHVYVITEEEIERQQADSVEDVLRLLPFIRVGSLSGLEPAVSMGGFGENGFGRTLILVDGRPVNRPDMQSVDWTQIPIETVERIEIIRGPASVQYGDAAVAGVVNIITSRTEPYTLFVESSVDSQLSNRQAITVTGGTDRLDASLAATRDISLTSRERTDAESWSVSPRIDVQLTERAKASLYGTYIPSSYQMPGGLSKERYEADPDDPQNPADELDNLYWDVGASFGASFEDLSVSLPVTYSFDGTDARFLSRTVPPDYTDPTYYESELRDIQIRPQASYTWFFSDAWYLVVSGGADVRLSRLDVQYRKTSGNALDVSRSGYGFWVSNKFSWNDIVLFDIGLRYDATALDFESAFSGGRLEDDDRHSSVAYDLGLAYRPVERVKLSAKYGRVFRVPFLDEHISYFDGSFNTDLSPERGHHIAAGIDTEIAGVDLSISPYLLAMEDEIVWDGTANANAGETLHYGISVSGTYEHERFILSAGYSYDRAEFSSGDNDGSLIPLVPAHKVTASGTLFLPADLSLYSSVGYSSGFYEGGDDVNMAGKVSGRTEWDTVLSWQPAFTEGMKLYGVVRNILDDRTPTFVSWGGWYPMPGRTFEVGASWRY